MANAAPTDPRDRLIVALDFPSREPALALLKTLGSQVRWVKVGLELYLAEGRGFVQQLRADGYEVFLDLKLHDIPNTVAGAVRSAAASGAGLLTVHAAGGPAMLQAAADAAAGLPSAPRLLAVTVLTSMDAAQLIATGVAATPARQVITLAEMAVASGIKGLVCSPRETSALRVSKAAKALLVVPGIRGAGDAVGDQQRTASAGDAIRSGADMLVVGRPITQVADPSAAAEAVLAEIAAAL